MKKPKTPRPRRARAKLLTMPPADFYRLPDFEVRGGVLMTEGCRRVLDFTPEKLVLDTGGVIVTLYGRGLRIESLVGKRLLAAGRVRRVEFAPKWPEAPGAQKREGDA